MKWTLAASSHNQEIYELWNENERLLTLDFHPFTSSARIEHAGEKRVFMIRKEGFLRNKTVLRNEYGIRIGSLNHEKLNVTQGQIELNDEKFSYVIKPDPLPELTIYRDNIDNPFVVCGLNSTAESHYAGQAMSFSQYFLLMSLCWYMILPAITQEEKVYAL